MRIRSLKFLVLSVLLVLLLTSQRMGMLQVVEYQFQDVCYQSGGLISPDIYVIGIDEKTLIQYGRRSDWGCEKMAELVVLLNEDPDTAPTVIALDIGFYASGDEKTDQVLIDAVSKQDNIVTVFYTTFGKQIETEQEDLFWVSERVKAYEIPFEGLRERVSWGFGNVPLDSNGLVRHRIDYFEMNGKTEYSFASEIYRKYMGKLPENELSYIPFSGYPYNYHGSETAELSFRDVINGTIPKKLFAGSIVFIGAYDEGMIDSYHTAVSHDIPMCGVEVHANILQALLDENLKKEPKQLVMLVITFTLFAVAFLTWFFRKLWPTSGASLILISGYRFFTVRAYEQGFVMPLLYPMAAVLLYYIFGIGYQYIQERLEKQHVEAVFGGYMPKVAVNGILKGRRDTLRLGGQKKDVAVLFVDTRGFAPLSEALEPERVVAILNQYLEVMTDAVFESGGIADKFIGDVTMAPFNAPLNQEGYVSRAVKTGLDMAAAGKALGEDLLKLCGRTVSFGIGINCREAIIGNIDISSRMEYTAIGNTVNTAARLGSRAKAGEVLISPEVYKRLRDRIEVESPGPCTLKGVSEPMEIFRVTGARYPVRLAPQFSKC